MMIWLINVTFQQYSKLLAFYPHILLMLTHCRELSIVAEVSDTN